jgi:hypothetical protein
VQTTKFKDVLNFLGSNLDIDGHGTTEKVQPQRCFAKGTRSLLEIRVCLGEEDEFISKTAQAQIKAALAKTRPFTAIRVSVTPFLGTTVRTTTRRRRRWLTGGQANFQKQQLL